MIYKVILRSLPQPGVQEGLGRAKPLLWLRSQKKSNQLLSLRGNERFTLILPRTDLQEELFLILCLEGTVAIKHGI
jgi:hypothetical protein